MVAFDDLPRTNGFQALSSNKDIETLLHSKLALYDPKYSNNKNLNRKASNSNFVYEKFCSIFKIDIHRRHNQPTEKCVKSHFFVS